MSTKRPTEVGATRGGPHHALGLRPDQCMLCRQVGHRAAECPNHPTTTTTIRSHFGSSVSLKQVDLLCVSKCGATSAVGLMANGAGTSASRRRQRRLRSWLRHERQTVAMELAAVLHHSRDARSTVVRSALRGQKDGNLRDTEPLEEVSEPPGGAVTVGDVAAPVPSVA